MFGRTFVLLSILVVGTGNPAFALKTGGGGGFSPMCLPGQVQVCTSGPPPVCHCSDAAGSKKSSVTPTRQGSGTTQGNGGTGNKDVPSSGKKH
jgi:hypothetical protein